MSVWCRRERYFPKKFASRLDESKHIFFDVALVQARGKLSGKISLSSGRYAYLFSRFRSLLGEKLLSLASKPVFKFEIKSSNLTMSISLRQSVVLHGCGGLREAVSIRRIPFEGCRRRVRPSPGFKLNPKGLSFSFPLPFAGRPPSAELVQTFEKLFLTRSLRAALELWENSFCLSKVLVFTVRI